MAKGNMNARERIEYLLDDNSFVEIGKYVTARNTDYNLNSEKAEGDGVITGYGVMDGRMVYVYSQDASVLGGSVGEMHAKKIVALYDLAMKTGAPVIGMCRNQITRSIRCVRSIRKYFRKTGTGIWKDRTDQCSLWNVRRRMRSDVSDV